MEVESATLHMPNDGGQHMSGLTHESGWKSKLNSWRSRGTTAVSTKVSSLRPMAMRHVDTVRSGMRTGMMRVDGQLRSNPSKWAGIAAGAGFLLGMSGRLMRGRHKHHPHQPAILIIESAC